MEKTRKKSLWCKANTYHCRSAKAYSLAYAIKMLFKNAMKNKTDNEITDFTVYPLEGFWKKQMEKSLIKINWNTH